jgi:uncharacterized repeat protein (TIGR03803 family)
MNPIACFASRRAAALLVACATIVSVPSGAGTLPASRSYSTLQSFVMPPGAYPEGPLTPGADGLLYGTLSDDFSQSSNGHLFRVEKDGTVTFVHDFAADGSDGQWPAGRLALGPDGWLYGTTSTGGAGRSGTVYRFLPDGTFQTVYAFSFDGDSFTNPAPGLVTGSDGNLYGLLTQWGLNSQVHSNAVFRMSPSGALTILHVFSPALLNVGSMGVSAFGADGRLYGTSEFSGDYVDCGLGCGTLWAVSMDGTFEMVHTFTGGSDGENPQGELLTTSKGEIYGTTFRGGAVINDATGGVIFRLNRKGRFEPIYNFAPEDPIVGSNPASGLAEDINGHLVGTTAFGGAYKKGTLFSLFPTKRTARNLHSFGATSEDGDNLLDDVTVMPDGTIFGVTYLGGTANEGTLFQLLPKR